MNRGATIYRLPARPASCRAARPVVPWAPLAPVRRLPPLRTYLARRVLTIPGLAATLAAGLVARGTRVAGVQLLPEGYARLVYGWSAAKAAAKASGRALPMVPPINGSPAEALVLVLTNNAVGWIAWSDLLAT